MVEHLKVMLVKFASELSQIAGQNGMKIASCAESIDLTSCGIEHNSCIDKQLVERIIGCKISASKDKNQRKECGCVESVEVGTYHTCKNGCMYCYANDSVSKVRENCALYDSDSPILCSRITDLDIITERKVRSLKISY